MNPKPKEKQIKVSEQPNRNEREKRTSIYKEESGVIKRHNRTGGPVDMSLVFEETHEGVSDLGCWPHGSHRLELRHRQNQTATTKTTKEKNDDERKSSEALNGLSHSQYYSFDVITAVPPFFFLFWMECFFFYYIF